MSLNELYSVVPGMDKFSKYYRTGIHLQLEKLDCKIPDDPDAFTVLHAYVNQCPKLREFFEYHRKMTTPVFGEWNYDKRKAQSLNQSSISFGSNKN
ncbi:MAG: hypothetical protein EBZ49_03040 [Proteobacteria bacterium]|nr:hypothetical protein [Pseudomonadota bacterium]